MKTTKLHFDPNQTVFCEMKTKNNGHPFEVSVQSISDSGKTAVVKTNSGHNVEFSTSTKNLYNA